MKTAKRYFAHVQSKLEEVLEHELSNIENWNRDKLSEIIYNIEIDKDNNIYINYKYNVFSNI